MELHRRYPLQILCLFIWCCFHYVKGQCGGVTLDLTASTNTFQYLTSPNHPSNYDNYQTCTYKIDSGGTDRKAAISFIVFNLERSFDFFKVFDGSSSLDTLLGSHTGTVYNGFYISTGQYLYLQFTSDYSVTMSGFKIQYLSVLDSITKQACGSTVTVDISSIGTEVQYALSSFPNALTSSYSVSTCDWTITAPTTTDQFTLTIVFTDVNTEGTSGYNCGTTSGNGIWILNGPALQYQTCHVETSEVVLYGDGSQDMTVKFKAPFINNIDRGILVVIKYTGTTAPVSMVSVATQASVTSTCGTASNPIQLTADNVTTKYVTSPNYPSPYGNNLACWYRITSSTTGTSVKLSPIQINTDSSDYIYIYDGPSQSYVELTGYSGDISLGADVLSSGNSLSIYFTTDGSNTNTGFYFGYVDSAPVIPSCVPNGYENVTVDTSTQYLDSHAGFGISDYSNNLDSYWLVSKPSESDTLYSEFTTFRIESQTSCGYDYVKVYDGACIDSSKLLLTLCGEYSTDYTYEHSSGKYLLVHFHTDSSVVYKGWRVAYSTSNIIAASSEEDSDSNTKFIILGVILGLIFIVVVAASICAYRNSRRAKTVPLKKLQDVKTVSKHATGKKFNPSSVVIVPTKQKLRPVREPKRHNQTLDSETETEPPSFTDSHPLPPPQPPNQTVYPQQHHYPPPQQQQYPPPPQPPPNMHQYPPPPPPQNMSYSNPTPYPPLPQEIPGPFQYVHPLQYQRN